MFFSNAIYKLFSDSCLKQKSVSGSNFILGLLSELVVEAEIIQRKMSWIKKSTEHLSRGKLHEGVGVIAYGETIQG